MSLSNRIRVATTFALLAGAAQCAPVRADDQTLVGAGNATATALAQGSPLVRTSMRRMELQLSLVHDRHLRGLTYDALFNSRTCVFHRSEVTEAKKLAILNQLKAEALYSQADAAAFPGGAWVGVFPAIRDEGTICPHLPQSFATAPAGVFGGHGSFPGGLAIHASFNMSSSISFASNYRLAYGITGSDGLPHMAMLPPFDGPHQGDLDISQDEVIAAPMWHDWAKTMVFQWNADGSEFAEFNFGGNGATDNNGAAGDSRTGGHHILSLAESIARGLPARFVITQASAHTAPSLGNEFKVVNWIRAASIIAQANPISRGYLVKDGAGAYRLPPFPKSGGIDLNAVGQVNLLVEYEIHNLSDADFTFSIPAVTESQAILRSLAPQYGYDPADVATYTTRFRNPALTYLSGERLLIIYGQKGIAGVKQQLDLLRSKKII